MTAIRQPPLTDSFGRLHDNLRISVTDRCNIRCTYCMPETGVPFTPHGEILTYEEIERFVRVAVTIGVDKVRVTGGEPLLRPDAVEFVRELIATPGVESVQLSTNGTRLPQLARRWDLYLVGVDRPRHSRRAHRRGGRAAGRLARYDGTQAG